MCLFLFFSLYFLTADFQAKSMYHKDAALHARKLEWMLLHRRDELRKIMHDNGTVCINQKLLASSC